MKMPPNKTLLKYLLVVVLIIVCVLVWLVLVVAVAVRVSPAARQFGSDMWIRYLVYSFDKAAERGQRAALQDTVGGKTPEETLEMYIEAVDKGDYKLASRYFVIEGQKQEFKSLTNSSQNNVKNIQGYLKIALQKGGEYTLDKRQYVIHRPILVHLVKYPSGNWKILEI
ncbi:MAG: hypothetical protein Q7R92_01820 [bacterium]|nr:hypothetical protein [bacterium]